MVMTVQNSEEITPIGAVFTPLDQAQLTIKETGLYEKWLDGASILDPTAGNGRFLEAFIKTARQKGERLTESRIDRLCGVEMQQQFVNVFLENMKNHYKVDFPSRNFIKGDFFFTELNKTFDFLIGNPPWLNFCDLEDSYKEKIKPLFLSSGLGQSKKELLLGNSRIDIAALIVTEAVKKNLKEAGQAYFFLPLSLFLGEGAHKRFRRLLNNGFLSVDRIDDYRHYSIFPGIATRYGFATFTKGNKTTYPIPYHMIKNDRENEELKAYPLDGDDSSLLLGKEQNNRPFPRIIISKKSRPRQGLNSCGVNRLFIFDKAEKANVDLLLVTNKEIEALLPSQLIYPLIGADQFKGEEKHRYVFLPYGSNGKVLTQEQLSQFPYAVKYLNLHKSKLKKRKGVLIGSSIKKGQWWSLLGVGPYSFAPWKVVWEAYGKKKFRPLLFSSSEGRIWQPNQALQAYLSFQTREEALSALHALQNPLIEDILKSQGMEGTCNWAQPGKMMKFFSFTEET